jgi:hypothetical protein
MSNFNVNSQMPEHSQGHIETEQVTQHGPESAPEPSVSVTDRFGLEQKSWLTRKYDIKISAAGNPYFTPSEVILKTLVADAQDAMSEARARISADEDMQEQVEELAETCTPYFEAQLEAAGEDREWLARSLVIWPLTDQVGYHLYKATSGEADLIDYAGYLARTDADVKRDGQAALEVHAKFQERVQFVDRAYEELAKVDALIASVDPDSLKYNFEAIIRQGYQSAANLDTRNHLRGVQGRAPITSDQPLDEFKSNVLASRRAASQAA